MKGVERQGILRCDEKFEDPIFFWGEPNPNLHFINSDKLHEYNSKKYALLKNKCLAQNGIKLSKLLEYLYNHFAITHFIIPVCRGSNKPLFELMNTYVKKVLHGNRMSTPKGWTDWGLVHINKRTNALKKTKNELEEIQNGSEESLARIKSSNRYEPKPIGNRGDVLHPIVRTRSFLVSNSKNEFKPDPFKPVILDHVLDTYTRRKMDQSKKTNTKKTNTKRVNKLLPTQNLPNIEEAIKVPEPTPPNPYPDPIPNLPNTEEAIKVPKPAPPNIFVNPSKSKKNNSRQITSTKSKQNNSRTKNVVVQPPHSGINYSKWNSLDVDN